MGWNTCFKCKCKMWIDDPLDDAASKARGKITFYCSYGHPQVYVEGENEETKLRRERDRLKQDNARLHDEAQQQYKRAIKAEGDVKRLKKRASAGTCPCCKRTFSNMARHMKKEHPTFVADTGAKVVPIKSEVA